MAKRLNLALQGGGAHGAYTWGVLDRILEEKDIEISGISGTSAGAMNAAILVDGYIEKGRDGAKEALAQYWEKISMMGRASPIQPLPINTAMGDWNLDWSLSYNYFDMLSRIFSPYELNPLDLNPLRWALEEFLDVEKIQKYCEIPLYITATSVTTGQARVFESHEITVDTLLASACIPFVFQAVEIDGEPYWDGGYMGNPVMWPLIYGTDVLDVLLVQINPLTREGTPKRAFEIINRLNEISFNSSLIAEMRGIEFVSRMVKENKLDPEKYKDMRMHMIEAHKEMQELDASSKFNTSWAFFTFLRDIGRAKADSWIKENKASIGKKSTVDIRETFLMKPKRELEQKTGKPVKTQKPEAA